jgi:hypothetical protein
MSEQNESKNVWLSGPMIIGYVLTVVVAIFWIGFFSSISVEIGDCVSNFCIFWNLKPNEIGDTFAGLFGSLAFVWIVVTVLVQGIELREQRKEFEDMNRNMECQRFENTFFEMLTTLSRIASQLRLKVDRNIKDKPEGRVVFEMLGSEFTATYKKKTNLASPAEKRATEAYDAFWNARRTDLSHYFRYLFNFLRLISDSEVSKPYHAKILRSQISDEELKLLFYNCLSTSGKKMQKYAVEFELFDNMHPSDLVETSHAKLIDPKVFGPDKRGMLNN